LPRYFIEKKPKQHAFFQKEFTQQVHQATKMPQNQNILHVINYQYLKKYLL